MKTTKKSKAIPKKTEQKAFPDVQEDRMREQKAKVAEYKESTRSKKYQRD